MKTYLLTALHSKAISTLEVLQRARTAKADIEEGLRMADLPFDQRPYRMLFPNIVRRERHRNEILGMAIIRLEARYKKILNKINNFSN